MTDERRHGNSETRNGTMKISKRKTESGKIKIGSFAVGVDKTSEISSTKLGK